MKCLKKLPPCALVEVECIMALYNKGRRTVLLLIHEHKWRSSLKLNLSQKQRM